MAAERLELAPPEDLQLIVATLMELLKSHREELNSYGPTLRRRYEEFACALRNSGFRFHETKDRKARASNLRRLGELAERHGNAAGAIAFYTLAIRSWPGVGCVRALERLCRLDINHL